MAQFYPHLEPKHEEFIREQKIFFTASAAAEGRINLSPKGMDTFRILSPTQVAYLDLTGSGAETAAHILADGRLTIMLCSFTEKPLIMRLYGHGRVIPFTDPGIREWQVHFPVLAGQRQIVAMDIEAVQTSCGMAVPFYDFAGERRSLVEWAEKQGEERLVEYRQKKNMQSIDGLPTGLV